MKGEKERKKVLRTRRKWSRWRVGWLGQFEDWVCTMRGRPKLEMSEATSYGSISIWRRKGPVWLRKRWGLFTPYIRAIMGYYSVSRHYDFMLSVAVMTPPTCNLINLQDNRLHFCLQW